MKNWARGGVYLCVGRDVQAEWVGPVPGAMLPCRTDDQVVRIVAVNGTHRLPDALAPLINVRSGAERDKQTPNVTKCLRRGMYVCMYVELETTTAPGQPTYRQGLRLNVETQICAKWQVLRRQNRC